MNDYRNNFWEENKEKNEHPRKSLKEDIDKEIEELDAMFSDILDSLFKPDPPKTKTSGRYPWGSEKNNMDISKPAPKKEKTYEEKVAQLSEYNGSYVDEILVEELAELIQVIQKHRRVIHKKMPGNVDYQVLADNIIEEMADVYITLRELQIFYCIPTDVLEKAAKSKIDRTLSLIENS